MVGILLFCRAFDSLGLKERKKMLMNTINSKVISSLMYNPNFMMVIIKVLNAFDDYKNLKGLVLTELGDSYDKLMEEDIGNKLLMYIFSQELDNEVKKRFKTP